MSILDLVFQRAIAGVKEDNRENSLFSRERAGERMFREWKVIQQGADNCPVILTMKFVDKDESIKIQRLRFGTRKHANHWATYNRIICYTLEPDIQANIKASPEAL